MCSTPSADSMIEEAEALYRDLLNTDLNDLIHNDAYKPAREHSNRAQGMAAALEPNPARSEQLLNRVHEALKAFPAIATRFIQLSREIQQVGQKIHDVANGYYEASKRCETAAKQLTDAEKEN